MSYADRTPSSCKNYTLEHSSKMTSLQVKWRLWCCCAAMKRLCCARPTKPRFGMTIATHVTKVNIYLIFLLCTSFDFDVKNYACVHVCACVCVQWIYGDLFGKNVKCIVNSHIVAPSVLIHFFLKHNPSFLRSLLWNIFLHSVFCRVTDKQAIWVN